MKKVYASRELTSFLLKIRLKTQQQQQPLKMSIKFNLMGKKRKHQMRVNQLKYLID